MRPVPLDRICAATAALCTFSISEPPVLEGCGCSLSSLAWRIDKQCRQHPGSDGSEEEPMSSAAPSDDEFPIQDDETLSELVRTPSRTSGDLQQHADLEDDLEPVPDFQGGIVKTCGSAFLRLLVDLLLVDDGRSVVRRACR